jgi:uncharacterized protein
MEAVMRPSTRGPQARRGDWIVLRSCNKFWPLDPRVGEFTHEDIAHGLARRDRWNGILDRFYSVGEHSVRVAALAAHLASVENQTTGARIPLALVYAHGLLHDANEGLLVDLPRPIKACMPDWHAIEADVQRVILESFKLWPVPAEVARVVSLADDLVLLLEANDPHLMSEELRAMTLCRPEIYKLADHHLTVEAIAAADPLKRGDFDTWEHGRAALVTLFGSLMSGEVPVRSQGAASWRGVVAANTVNQAAFEPPAHLRAQLQGEDVSSA